MIVTVWIMCWSGIIISPLLALPEEKHPIGKWSRMHQLYLKEHHGGRYEALCLSCELWTYLADLNEQAQERYERIIDQMKDAEGVTEDLKRQDWLRWVQAMSNIQSVLWRFICS